MTRRLLAVSLCAALFATCTTVALGQRAGRRPARRPAAALPAVAFDGALARYFPADTFLYVEVSHLDALAEQLGGADWLYMLLRSAVGSAVTPGKPPFPSAVQFKGLLSSRLAIGVLPPPPSARAATAKGEPQVAVLVQAPSAEVNDLLGRFVAEASASTTAKASRPLVRTVRGVRVTTRRTGTAGKPLATASVGTSTILGDPALVVSMISKQGTAQSRALADEPSYASASGRAPSSRQVFAFLNGKPLVRAFDEGFSESARSWSGKAPKTAEVAALRRFLGIDAIAGGSLSAFAEGGTLSIQAAMEIDRSRYGLVSVLSDPPALGMRSLGLLPADTDFVTLTSVDLVRIYDLILEVFTPQLAQAIGAPPPPDVVAMIEGAIGMRLRDEFLASFGTEFAGASRVKQATGAVKIQDATPAAATDFVGLVEARSAERIVRGLSNVFRPSTTATPGNTMTAAPEVYEGVEIGGSGSFRWAVIDGFLVFGGRDELVAIVDAHKGGTVLGTSAAFAAAAGSVPENTIYATFMSPRFFEYAARMAAKEKGAAPAEAAFPNGLFASVQKDATGISSSFKIPMPNLRVLLEDSTKKATASR